VYSDAKGDHILMGPLVDTRSRTNLTQQRLDALKVVNFDSLPLDKAITIVKGKGERRIAVFSDPDCPFCRRLEKELAGLDNLTVHVFLLPLAELHPQAVGIASDMWCAEDRAKAWSAYMLDGRKPDAGRSCTTPIEAIAALAGELGISGTPAIVLNSGRRVEGAVPAAKLEALINGS
jgi:thiol:disulfide interchange protein DsbC